MSKKRYGLITNSTRTWLQTARQKKGFSFFELLHGYIYGRWPYFYIGIGTGEHPLARMVAPLATKLFSLVSSRRPTQPSTQNESMDDLGIAFANTYHGKVVPLEAARQLVSIKEEIQLSLPESIVPYDRARDIILKNPEHIVALDCPCRAARPNPCKPLDVCLIIGEPFAAFVLEHHPARSRAISSDEAHEILKSENRRGHVHHAFFKDAMFGRFYAICNCCSCCCGAINAHKNGTPMLASSGFVAQVDANTCNGCSKCKNKCQFQAIEMTTLNGGSRQTAQVDPQKCMGCGVCANNCSRSAITLMEDHNRGEPLEIFRLMEEARQPD